MVVDDKSDDIVGYIRRKCKKSADDEGMKFAERKRTSSSARPNTNASSGELTIREVECRNDDWELMRWKNARGVGFIVRLDFDQPLCRQQRRGLTRGALSPMTLSCPATRSNISCSHQVIIIPFS